MLATLPALPLDRNDSLAVPRCSFVDSFDKTTGFVCAAGEFLPPRAHQVDRMPLRPLSLDRETVMDIVKLAKDSGLLVVLDGMIGKTEYRSVQGSLAALERFADAVGKQIATHEESKVDVH
jgi:hypothetical protein